MVTVILPGVWTNLAVNSIVSVELPSKIAIQKVVALAVELFAAGKLLFAPEYPQSVIAIEA